MEREEQINIFLNSIDSYFKNIQQIIVIISDSLYELTHLKYNK